jgi:hypothetical protein
MLLDGGDLSAQQLVGSSGNIIIQQWINQAGATKFAVRNDGALSTAGRASASAVATVKGVLPIYDETNTLYGYVPVYTSYS